MNLILRVIGMGWIFHLDYMPVADAITIAELITPPSSLNECMGIRHFHEEFKDLKWSTIKKWKEAIIKAKEKEL